MLILAVDPGVNGTGWALLRARDAKLCDCGTLHGKGTDWGRKCVQILNGYERIISRNYIGQVFIESPVFMHGYGGYTAASTGSLVKLSMLCGALYLSTVMKHGTCLVEPSKWKGQLPKKVCNARVIEKLTKESLCDSGFLEKISNHALDAIGLGLWALGEFK
jgi:hypothetical protein